MLGEPGRVEEGLAEFGSPGETLGGTQMQQDCAPLLVSGRKVETIEDLEGVGVPAHGFVRREVCQRVRAGSAQAIVTPLSTGKTCPVTMRDSSEAR